ncbi:hypothetical protein GPALN_010327 [Globodera pallida]|nr:hypothetical protein GPALN_010327 [Globodera pallida]
MKTRALPDNPTQPRQFLSTPFCGSSINRGIPWPCWRRNSAAGGGACKPCCVPGPEPARRDGLVGTESMGSRARPECLEQPAPERQFVNFSNGVFFENGTRR